MSHPALQPVRVFITSTVDTGFVRDDVELLSRHFDVDLLVGSGLTAAREIFSRARRADVSISWLGSTYTLPLVEGARRGGGRSVVILGGVDVAREPELGYGLWNSRLKSSLLHRALRLADHIVAVDASLREDLERLTEEPWERVEILPTGYDHRFWQPLYPKHRHVLTVAGCDTVGRLRIKGIDLLLEAARRLTSVEFRIVGSDRALVASLAGAIPENVSIVPPVPRPELRELYGRAHLYCQPSRREGLPNSVCEAMLSGCFPVGTRVGGMATAIGEHGIVVERDDLAGLCNAIEEGIARPEIDGIGARRHIVESFSMERRERRLVELVARLAGREELLPNVITIEA